MTESSHELYEVISHKTTVCSDGGGYGHVPKSQTRLVTCSARLLLRNYHKTPKLDFVSGVERRRWQKALVVLSFGATN